jgi:hypothetical protein
MMDETKFGWKSTFNLKQFISYRINLANAERVVTDDIITSKYHHGQNLQ